jgi:hypothetical protein
MTISGRRKFDADEGAVMNESNANGTPRRATRIFVIAVFLTFGIVFAITFVITPAFFLVTLLTGDPVHTQWLDQNMSDQQKQFMAGIKKYRDSYNGADGSAKPAYRQQRANAICNLFNGNLSVANWLGFVKEFWSTPDGRAGLAVWLPAEYNNMSSEILLSGEQTLIPPSDPVSKTILTLSKETSYSLDAWQSRGQALFFSGQFMPSTTDCLQEVSRSASGSMTEPQWLFKFSSLSPFAPDVRSGSTPPSVPPRPSPPRRR